MSNKDKQSMFSAGEDPHQVLGRIGTMTPRPWLSAVIPVNRLPSGGRGLQNRNNSISRKSEKGSEKGPTECGSLFTYTSDLELNSYSTHWGLTQLTYQILCAVVGALEMFLACWIILIYTVTHLRPGLDQHANILSVFHPFHTLFYFTYGLLWINGFLLLTASGICVKESKFTNLAHVILALITAVLFAFCFVYNLKNPTESPRPKLKGISAEGNKNLGHMINAIPIAFIITGGYFSLALTLILFEGERLMKRRRLEEIRELKEWNNAVHVLVSPPKGMPVSPASLNSVVF